MKVWNMELNVVPRTTCHFPPANFNGNTWQLRCEIGRLFFCSDMRCANTVKFDSLYLVEVRTLDSLLRLLNTRGKQPAFSRFPCFLWLAISPLRLNSRINPFSQKKTIISNRKECISPSIKKAPSRSKKDMPLFLCADYRAKNWLDDHDSVNN